LIGIVFLSIWVERAFDLQSGRTIFTGGLLLAVMVLPTIVTLSDDALHNVPQKYREAAKSLGFYRYEVIKNAVLPIAKTDIIGAALLALGRVLGETMAVMLVIGGIDRIPGSFFNVLVPGQTMTSKLGREIAETAFGSLHFSAMIFIGLILLVFVLLITMIALTFFYNPEHRLYE
jgi:ABC-type phosphate transport system permease subunit